FSSRRRHTRCLSDWSSDVCSSDLAFEIGRQYLAEILLGGSVGRTVIVREIEMGDAAIEGAAQYVASRLEHVRPTEILPQTERNRSEERRVGKECSYEG